MARHNSEVYMQNRRENELTEENVFTLPNAPNTNVHTSINYDSQKQMIGKSEIAPIKISARASNNGSRLSTQNAIYEEAKQ